MWGALCEFFFPFFFFLFTFPACYIDIYLDYVVSVHIYMGLLTLFYSRLWLSISRLRGAIRAALLLISRDLV